MLGSIKIQVSKDHPFLCSEKNLPLVVDRQSVDFFHQTRRRQRQINWEDCDEDDEHDGGHNANVAGNHALFL